MRSQRIPLKFLSLVDDMKKIVSIFGTRPEIIKMAPLIPLLDKEFEHKFLFTSQHYSESMMGVFFRELGVRAPDKFLDVNDSNLEKLQAAVQDELKNYSSEWVATYGDTNSTLAAARAAKLLGKKVIHIEAGLRAYDNRLPEEKNRVEIDGISSILLAPSELAKKQLEKEGITENVEVVGNLVADAVKFFYVPKPKKERYVLVTAHRQENVDDLPRLSKILEALSQFPKVIFPVHPRTKKRIEEFGLHVPGNVELTGPASYKEFLSLLGGAQLVLTDSGGVQEEAISLNVPCLTLRESTERWETVEAGGNFLVGLEPLLIGAYARQISEGTLGERMRKAKNPYGENVSEKIIEILKRKI